MPDRIQFFPEDPILGTGGALKNAEAFLRNGPFLVHNSDILLDIDFTRLIETHLNSGNIATLVTHRHPKLSNVVVDENDQVLDVENPGDSRPDPNRVAKKVAYTGIALYSPEILNFLPAAYRTPRWPGSMRQRPATRSRPSISPAPPGTTSARLRPTPRGARYAAGERRDRLSLSERPLREDRDRRICGDRIGQHGP